MTQLKERDYFFDNARMILIFLVVFGHLLQPYTEESKYLSSLYLTIYSFHMPCFYSSQVILLKSRQSWLSRESFKNC